RNLNEGWMGNIQLNTQQSVYNTSQLNGSVNYNKHNLALQFIPYLSSNFNYNTGYNSFTYTDDSKDSTTTDHYRRYSVAGGGLNADYYINNNNTLSYKGWYSTVNGNTIDNNLIYHQPSNQSGFNNPIQTYVNGTDHYIYNFGNIYFHHQFDSLNKQNIDVNVDYNKFYQEQNSVGNFNQLDQQGNLIGNIGIYNNHLPQNFFNLSERIDYGNQLSNHLKWILGIQFSQTQVDNNLKYYNGYPNNYVLDTMLSKHYAYTENYGSGYTSFAYTISDKWQMNIGGRIETTQYNTQEKNTGISKDSNYVNFFPSFGLSYAANAKNNFGFSFARKIMRPSIELLFPGRTYYNPTFFAQNNPFLQPQLYNNAEFTYVYNNLFSIVASYSHIQNAYSNFIIPVVENNQNKFNNTYLNYGSSNTYSITFTLYKTIINNKWDTYINTAFNYTHYKGNTNVENILLNNANGMINWDNYVYLTKKKDWMAFVTLHYNSPQQTLAAHTINGISNLDIMIKKTFKNFSFYIYLSDIYNGSSKFWQSLFTNPLFTANNSLNNTYNRSISLNFTYQFGNRNLKT
ncbi:outer membrane beta-barrel family protein, partial [Hydrotalea sp.]|uniref:outer membrane beta-barrel family protein n=1 Tax=Hydrotalea sp. TaxID=2881279 RepID=UPI003D0C06C9